MHLFIFGIVLLWLSWLWRRKPRHSEDNDNKMLRYKLCIEQLRAQGLEAQLRVHKQKIDELTKLCDSMTEKIRSDDRKMGVELNQAVMDDLIHQLNRAKAALRAVLRDAGSSEEDIEVVMQGIDGDLI